MIFLFGWQVGNSCRSSQYIRIIDTFFVFLAAKTHKKCAFLYSAAGKVTFKVTAKVTIDFGVLGVFMTL